VQLDFTSEQDELRSSVRAVLARECPPALVRTLVETGDREQVRQLWRTMVSLDWPALTIAEDRGGLGLGFVELAVVLEELGRVAAPGPLAATLTQFLPAIHEAAPVDVAASWEKAAAAGEVTGTLALAEQAGTWDMASVATVARPAGDGFVIDGHKHAVVEVGDATELVVVAMSPADGPVLAIAPVAAVEIDAVPSFDGSRPVSTVRFADVEIAPERVLARGEAAAAALERALHQAVVATALDIVGACQTIFDTTVEYAGQRHQFGVPIGSFQAVKHKLADLYVALERARASAYFAAACIAEDDPRRALAASMAKAAAGDCQRLAAKEGIQLLGGIGYTWEHDQHLFVKRAKAGEILFGSAAWHRGRIADLLGI
jgi:alkylation response protein AidB-like acyl-CoA dehydrogenase